MNIEVTELRAERAGNVLTLALDGPSTRNAVSLAVYKAIRSEIIAASEDPEVRTVVLTGLNGYFSSGGDVRNLQKSAQSSMAEVVVNTDALNAMILSIRDFPKPVIAAVEGGAAGAAFALVLACDMIIASPAARFTVAHVKVGLTPDGGLTYFLRESLPRQIVSEMCLTGSPVDAERLHALGVVNALVPEGQVLEEAKRTARRLSAGASNAMAVIKNEIAAASKNDLASQLVMEADAINRARFGQEAAEGLDAFLQKRPAKFNPGSAGS